MGPLNVSASEVIAGICRKRILWTVLQDCLGHQLVLPMQLLEVHTSMVQVIRDPQTDKNVAPSF